MHNLQNELNKWGEIFKENVILKFHIFYEQWQECPEDKDLGSIVENFIVHASQKHAVGARTIISGCIPTYSSISVLLSIHWDREILANNGCI